MPRISPEDSEKNDKELCQTYNNLPIGDSTGRSNVWIGAEHKIGLED